MSRACRRPGCDRTAVARLSYDAVTCQVWLDVMPERPGSVQEICELHVDRLTVPRGWMLCDRRVEEPAMFLTEPAPPPAPPARPVRARPRPSDPARLASVAEPGLFDPPGRSDDAEPPDPVDEVAVIAEITEIEEIEEITVVEVEVAPGDEDEAPGDGTLLRPSSPLLARAFRAAGTRPAVLAPRPDLEADTDRQPGDDDGAHG